MISTLATALALFAPLAPADILVVDAAGGGDYTQISLASDSAADGDTLLVKPGTYASFIVNDKALNVVADSGGGVVVNDYIAVINLAARREVLISGIEVRNMHTAPFVVPLYLHSNRGSVRVVDVDAFGNRGDHYLDGSHAAYIFNCPDVALEGCSFLGGEGGDSDWCSFTTPGAGVEVDSSRVVISDCVIDGGPPSGAFVSWDLGGDGGVACRVKNSSVVHLYGSTLRGAPGGSGDSSFTFCSAGDGGQGVWSDASSLCHILDSQISGGAAGLDSFGPNGNPGAAVQGPSTALSGTARFLSTPRLVREGSPLPVTVRGEIGDTVYLAVSRRANFLHSPALSGTWLTAYPTQISIVPLGTVGALGQVSGNYDRTQLPPTLEARQVHIQPFLFTSSGVARLGLARTTLIVDSSF